MTQPMRVEIDSGIAELVRDLDRDDAWALYVNGTAQSHVDLDDPEYLEFEYVRRLAHVVDLLADVGRPIRALHLGGGALTLPRYVSAVRPGSAQHVAELDARLVDLVRTALPWDEGGLVVQVGDARQLLAGRPSHTADLLVLDVYAGPRVPAHLTSVEFLREVSRVLTPDGSYAANLADSTPMTFARAQVATAAAVFEHVAVLVEPDVLRGRRFGNVVLCASHRPLPIADLAARVAGDPFPATLLHGRALDAFAAPASPTIDAAAVPSPQPPPGSFGMPPD